MRILLDTHVLLWWLADDERLSDEHRQLIAESDNEVLVSAVTIAEIAIKASLGKLDAPDDLRAVLDAGGFTELPFTSAHAALLRHLAWHHRDPFDRMLVAQASAEGVLLASADQRIREYDIAVR